MEAYTRRRPDLRRHVLLPHELLRSRQFRRQESLRNPHEIRTFCFPSYRLLSKCAFIGNRLGDTGYLMGNPIRDYHERSKHDSTAMRRGQASLTGPTSRIPGAPTTARRAGPSSWRPTHLRCDTTTCATAPCRGRRRWTSAISASCSRVVGQLTDPLPVRALACTPLGRSTAALAGRCAATPPAATSIPPKPT